MCEESKLKTNDSIKGYIMSISTFSKNKFVFFVALLVFNFLLTAISAGFVLKPGIETIFIIVRALSIIPVIALIKYRKGFSIALIVMLIIDLLFAKVFNVYVSIIEQNQIFTPFSTIIFAYTIIKLLLVLILIVAVYLLNYSKKINESLKHRKIIAVSAIVASTFLLFLSLSFSYSSAFQLIQIVKMILDMIIPITLSTTMIVYFSSYITKVQGNGYISQIVKAPVTTKTQQKVVVLNNESRFTGSTFGLLWLSFWTSFVTGITIGIAFPFMLCKKEKWMANHTYVNGRQLFFDGTGMQLFGNWIKWSLLVIVTLGIYALFVPIAIKKWTVSHIKFAE